ncbi:MAG: CPBP family intramembrane metalloprotease [Candidatus Methanofastidiosa archaeon]|nr:CPBP family intramembrane metalloprotease [Candidatus Methanofastidiosa archaeon]
MIDIILLIYSYFILLLFKYQRIEVAILPSLSADLIKYQLYLLLFPIYYYYRKDFLKGKKDDIVLLLQQIVSLFLVQIVLSLAFSLVLQSIAVNIYLLFVATAIIEEWVFRATLLPLLSKKIHPVLSNLIQAALFVGIHWNYRGEVVFVIITFITGVLQGYWYNRHHNFLFCAFSHAILNIIAVGQIIPYL